jgi:hypothetical protein
MHNFTIAKKEYDEICTRIGIIFAKKYFGLDCEYWWVADESGGVMHINDYFFNMEDMIDYMKYKYTSKKMFEHYDYALEELTVDRSPINIRNYKKLIKK